MSRTGFLAGILSGIQEQASSYRDTARKEQEHQDELELNALGHLATSTDPDIQGRAARAMLEISTGAKRPRGGFLAQFTGPAEVTRHPAVDQLLQFLRTPTQPEKTIEGPAVGGIKIEDVPRPGQAAMPPPPPQGGVGTTPPQALASPGGPPPAPSTLPVGQGVSFTSTGQHLPSTRVAAGPPPQIWDTPEQKAIKAARAKAQGDTEGDILGWMSMGKTREEAIKQVEQERLRRSAAAARDSFAEGEVIRKPDGSWVQVLYNRFNPMDRIEIPATNPAIRGVSSLNDDAQLAHEMFGSFYPNMPAQEVLRALTPNQRTAMYAESLRRDQAKAFATGTGTGTARINTELGMPIGVPAATSLGTDPTRPLNTLAGTTATRPMPDADVQKLADFQNGLDEADTLATTLAGIKTTGAMAKLQVMMPNFVTEFTGWGVSAKQRQAVIARVKQIIGKALEDGVLRKEDEIKYKDILPEISDPQEVAAAKLTGLKAALAQQKRTHEAALRAAGYRVGPGDAPPPGPGQIPAASPAPAGTPKVGDLVGMPQIGERRTINGQLAEWDGKGWKAVR